MQKDQFLSLQVACSLKTQVDHQVYTACQSATPVQQWGQVPKDETWCSARLSWWNWGHAGAGTGQNWMLVWPSETWSRKVCCEWIKCVQYFRNILNTFREPDNHWKTLVINREGIRVKNILMRWPSVNVKER